MVKYIPLLLLLMLSCKSNSEESHLPQSKNARTLSIIKEAAQYREKIIQKEVYVNDTFFLLKEDFVDPSIKYFHHIYETWDSIKYHSLIPKVREENFSLDDNPYYPINACVVTAQTNFPDIPTRWSEVIFAFDKYFLKFPSDFCYLDRKIISDSCLIHFGCEGPLPVPIKYISKSSATTYEIEFCQSDKMHKPLKGLRESLQITVVDSISGIAIWKQGEEVRLLADADKFRSLPIAYSDCNRNKCSDDNTVTDIDASQHLDGVLRN